MPVFPRHRQPDALAWFGGPNGQALLDLELNAVRQALAARPAQQPWLWIAAAPQGPAAVSPPPRTLILHRRGAGLEGSFRSNLPLPLGNESIGNLILQHALDDGGDALLDECVRVLEPGGRAWIFALNPWSPFHLRWRGSGLRGRGVAGWHLVLRRAGLQPCGGRPACLGPRWRQAKAQPEGAGATAGQRLGAVYVLQAEKRSAALVPPAPARRQWQAGAATA